MTRLRAALRAPTVLWLIAAGAAGATAGRATGAPIVWSPPTTITGDGDVSTTGQFVGAGNAGNVEATVVNGVTFAGMGNERTVGNFSFSSGGAISTVPTAFGVASPPFSSLSAGYGDLLDSGLFTHTPPSAPPAITLTISNLTPGQPYQFQWWVNDSRSDGDETRTTTATAVGSVTLEHNFQNAPGGVGQFALGTFVADGTTQQIIFQGAGGGPNVASTQVNGFQLRAVPEPGAAAAILVVLVAAARRRARARRAGATE